MHLPHTLHPSFATRALAALLAVCLHAPLFAGWQLRDADEHAALPEPGEVSPRRIH
jgi:hypothetical protein